MERAWFRVIGLDGIDRWNSARTDLLRVGDYIQEIPRPERFSALHYKPYLFYPICSHTGEGYQFDWIRTTLVERV